MLLLFKCIFLRKGVKMSNKYCPICGSKHTKKMAHAIEDSDINVSIAVEYFNINESKKNPLMNNYGTNM